MRSNSFRLIRAECYKLKSSAALYLVALVAILASGIVYLGHSIDIHSLAAVNEDPWEKYFSRAVAIYSIFLLSPFVILLTSAVIYIEQRADAWKYLYSLPVNRGGVFSAKLLILVALVGLATLLLIGLVPLSALALSQAHPEYELMYYRPDWISLLMRAARSVLAVLGVLGIHYFLSLRFRNFLVPLGIGMIGVILGLILAAANSPYSVYCPYSFPLIAQDFGMFRSDHREYWAGDWLTQIEAYSLICFVVSTVLGWWLERRRSIS